MDKHKSILSIDIDVLIKHGITAKQYILLYFLFIGDNEALKSYIKHVEKFTATEILCLRDRGFISMKTLALSFTFDNLFLTDLGLSLFNIKISNVVKELSEAYPKTAGDRKGLQSNKAAWSKKYLKIVGNNPDLHANIIRCIEAEKLDRSQTGQESYWPRLETYLNQTRWDVYEEILESQDLGVPRKSEYGTREF